MNVDVNEEIYLEEYNPQWKIYYQKEAAYIQKNISVYAEYICSISIHTMMCVIISQRKEEQ